MLKVALHGAVALTNERQAAPKSNAELWNVNWITVGTIAWVAVAVHSFITLSYRFLREIISGEIYLISQYVFLPDRCHKSNFLRCRLQRLQTTATYLL